MLFQILPLRRAAVQPTCSNMTFPQPCHPVPSACPPPLGYHQPASTLQPFPCQPELGTPAGKNHASAAEAAAFSNKMKQGEGFSTVLHEASTDPCSRSVTQRHFNLSYKSGTAQLTEVQKDKSLADSKFQLMYFADGKIYNAKGEVQGRFMLDGPPVAGQERSPLLYTKGTFENSPGGAREEYNPATLTLGGRKVFIVNGAPPGTVAVFRPVVGTELESRNGSNGLILHNPKAVGHEIEWVPETKATELRNEKLKRVEAEIAGLKQDGKKQWTLSDGTKVSIEEGRYFAERETVLPAKHPLGRSEVVFGKTGMTQKEFIGIKSAPSNETKPTNPELVPTPKPLPPPLQPMKTEPGAQEFPPLLPPPPMSPAPKASPQPEPMGKQEPKETPEPKKDPESNPKRVIVNETAENLTKLHQGVREHQLRMMQWLEAVAVAMGETAKDPKHVVSEVILKVGQNPLKTPKDYAKLLDSWAVEPIDKLQAKTGDTSIRFTEVVTTLRSVKGELEKMPDTASAEDIQKVFRKMRLAVHDSTAVFSGEFGFGWYEPDKAIGVGKKENIEAIIDQGYIAQGVDVNGRATPIADYLGRHTAKADRELDKPKK